MWTWRERWRAFHKMKTEVKRNMVATLGPAWACSAPESQLLPLFRMLSALGQPPVDGIESHVGYPNPSSTQIIEEERESTACSEIIPWSSKGPHKHILAKAETVGLDLVSRIQPSGMEPSAWSSATLWAALC